MIINYMLIVGLVLDLFLTYRFLGVYRNRFPDKDYAAIESNPLIRFFIREKGLGEGIIMSGLIIFLILLVLIVYLSENWKYFLAGVYYMMVTFHLLNFLALNRLKGGIKKNGKNKK